MFCKEYSNCEAPISVITNILSENDPIKFENISKELEALGFTKVKDLAQATFGIVDSIKLWDDSIKLFYGAFENYYQQHLDDLQKSAKLEMENGNFTRTQQICEKLLQQKPNDLNVIILMAESFFKCGNYDKSLSFLKMANNLNPNSFQMLINIAFNYWKLSNYDLARHYFLEAIKKSPSYNDCWIYYAESLIKTNDLKNAEYIYIQILKIYPDSYIIRNKYAKFLLSQNRLKKAEEQFEIALKSAPQCEVTLRNLGNLYYSANQYDKAILYYYKALIINPNLKITLFNLGKLYLKITNYPKAIQAFEKAIYLDPENASTLKNLAVAYCNQDNMFMSAETYKKYLKLLPDDLEINLKLAMIYFHNLDNYQEAEVYLKKCIELQPQRDDIYKNLYAVYRELEKHKNASDICIALGNLYLDKFDIENAIHEFATALYFNPKNAESHWKLGLALHNMGQYDSALIRYRKAMELRPSLVDVYYCSANIYEKQELYGMALEYYKMTLQLQPDHLNALINMSFLKQKLGQCDDIKAFNQLFEIDDLDANVLYKEFRNLNDILFHYKKALTYYNTSVGIYVRMGNICIELNMSKQSLNYFYKAIQLDSQCLEAFINIGSIQKDNENFIDAIHAYEATLKLKPDFPEIYCNLVICLQKVCDWSDYDSHMKKLKKIVNKHLNDDQVLSLLPHDSLFLPLSFEVQNKIASNYVKHCLEKLKKSIEEPQQFIYPTSLRGKLRIGFVSNNFSKHPVTNIVAFSFLNYSSEVQFCLYTLSSNDNIPKWMEPTLENISFKNLSQLKVIDAAKTINSDEIHVLVDLCGYTEGSLIEIFSLRPAPIQVSWIGNPNTNNTSAMPFVDYFFTSESDFYSNPPNEYIKKLFLLHSTFLAGNHGQKFSELTRLKAEENTNFQLNQSNFEEYDSILNNETFVEIITQFIQEAPCNKYTRELYNLPHNVVVFCNFSKLYKIDPFTFRTWLNILNNVPKSVLWLLHLNDAADNNLKKFANDLNFDSSRIIFANFIPKCEHLNRIQSADIYLESILYNGHMASLDALIEGIPVITLLGETYVSRITASQLTILGVTDTIAQNDQNYIDIAIKLGHDKNLLEEIKNNILNLVKNSNLINLEFCAQEIMKYLMNAQIN
ncbi:UDP-N-acetylglucosamine--peptide N-acetylglucosaminyltransferase 110 kDa subunit-like [Aphis gossypii]|uniref:UDP-N-acetylglucosamine--peptide N-acetylglucosaminyltransferase 110 kDa subunit-like n=1 Tax=Aphis gossypii TaxID=80765 RepID=UPI002158B7DD|nr:UDP-N-acetylglucosamine--peptide N-acetylglucosaminyltransferase 110 kDa subunit-like [Aphis gossypii]